MKPSSPEPIRARQIFSTFVVSTTNPIHPKLISPPLFSNLKEQTQNFVFISFTFQPQKNCNWRLLQFDGILLEVFLEKKINS